MSRADRDRSEKALSRTAGMYAPEESDCAVVPVNRPNKERQLLAEAGEGRVQTKENSEVVLHEPDTEREKSVPKDLEVCVEQPKRGGRKGSALCSTI